MDDLQIDYTAAGEKDGAELNSVSQIWKQKERYGAPYLEFDHDGKVDEGFVFAQVREPDAVDSAATG